MTSWKVTSVARFCVKAAGGCLVDLEPAVSLKRHVFMEWEMACPSAKPLRRFPAAPPTSFSSALMML